jgi:uncharacterized protein YbbK (DUF523 family)
MILVSSCLMGFPCRYDGTIKKDTRLYQALFRIAVPVCPEVLGGLSIPRPPSEIQGPPGALSPAGARVVNILGQDVTRAYVSGAQTALSIGMQAGCRIAVLKARSPACGVGVVYDGTFARRIRPGDGVFASLLRAHGFRLYTEDEFEDALLSLNK